MSNGRGGQVQIARDFRKTLLATAATGLCGLAAVTAVAQDRGTRDDPIVLDTITVTTTKTEKAVIDQMAGASVVTRTEVEQKQADRISDILQEMPGV